MTMVTADLASSAPMRSSPWVGAVRTHAADLLCYRLLALTRAGAHRMRKIIGVVVGGFAIAGLLTLAPIPAGAGTTQSILTVTKTVVGPGPTGPYTIVVACTEAPPDSVDPSSFDLNDGESRPVVINGTTTTCTVTETGTQGASTVSYACSARAVVDVTNTCDDDQTVTFGDTGDPRAQVDITNTFVAPAPAAAVPAAPTFTG